MLGPRNTIVRSCSTRAAWLLHGQWWKTFAGIGACRARPARVCTPHETRPAVDATRTRTQLLVVWSAASQAGGQSVPGPAWPKNFLKHRACRGIHVQVVHGTEDCRRESACPSGHQPGRVDARSLLLSCLEQGPDSQYCTYCIYTVFSTYAYKAVHTVAGTVHTVKY